jgi:CheY-like chemotaxis protein
MTDDVPQILLVDDDALVRTIARAVLQRAGIRVSEATDGRAALDFLDGEERVSLILLDLQMPGMDGMETLRAVRATPALSGITVLMLSASEDETERQAAIEAGANGFINKPIAPDRLLALVNQSLSAPS